MNRQQIKEQAARRRALALRLYEEGAGSYAEIGRVLAAHAEREGISIGVDGPIGGERVRQLINRAVKERR